MLPSLDYITIYIYPFQNLMLKVKVVQAKQFLNITTLNYCILVHS